MAQLLWHRVTSWARRLDPRIKICASDALDGRWAARGWRAMAATGSTSQGGEPISDGPYRITVVNRHAPGSLADFFEQEETVLDGVDGTGAAVRVIGTARAEGHVVRFHERGADRGGADARVWVISQVRSGFFMTPG